MKITLSRTVSTLQPSATIAMANQARELKAAGTTVYDLSLGEPDFDTPAHICEAARKAIEEGKTHYTPASGIPELKQAIVNQYKQRHGLDYEPSQVVVANGAKHALHNLFTALLDPGDEVIIPAPYWVSYSALVELAGGKAVIVSTTEADNFKLSPEAFQQAITDKTKILLLCSPSNPTGSMYTPEELGQLADVAIENDLLVLADEIYERLVYPGHKFASFPTVRPGLQERTLLVNGVSKTYAMTGWRIGWSITPPEIAKVITSLQSQETSNPCSISQFASIAALNGQQECVDEMLAEFTKRREYVKQRIEAIPGLSCADMGGAFYAFINVSEHLGRNYDGVEVNNSTDWCLQLLAQKQVAMVMGSAFGAEGYARASFATSIENLEAAFDRIEEFVKS